MDQWTNVKDLENIKRAETILLAKLNGGVDMGLPVESKWDVRNGFRFSAFYGLKTLSLG